MPRSKSILIIKYMAAVLAVLFTLQSVPANTAFADPAVSLSITPVSASVNQGSSVKVTLKVNAGINKITAVQACLNYDSDSLTLLNIDTTASLLTYTTPNSASDCAANQMQISRFSPKKQTGTFVLAVLTFKALQPSGTVALATDTTTSYAKDDTTKDSNGNFKNVLTGASGASITLHPVPVAPASANPSSPKPTTNNTPALTTKGSAQAGSKDTTSKPMSQSSKGTARLNLAPYLLLVLLVSGIIIYFIKFNRSDGLPSFMRKKGGS